MLGFCGTSIDGRVLQKPVSPATPAVAVARTPQQLDGTYMVMDAMRMVAACTVVVSHARDLLLVDATAGMSIGYRLFYFLTGFGHQAVMIFFVLSGYWIVRSVVGKTEGSSAFWAPYLVDRLARLWVVLIPTLIVGGLIDAVGLGLNLPVYTGTTGAHSIPTAGIGLRGVDFLGNLIFVQALIVPTFGSNGPLWSLAYEFWFYIWFPALWLTIRWRRPSVALASLALMIFYPAMAAGFLAWLAGGVVFALHHRLASYGDRRTLGAVLSVGGSIATIAALLASRVLINGPWADLALAVSFALLVLGLLLRPVQPHRAIEPIAQYGATASFSLYAIHFPILTLLTGLMAVRMQPGPYEVLYVAMMTFVTVFAGWIFARLTEAHTAIIRTRLRDVLAISR